MHGDKDDSSNRWRVRRREPEPIPRLRFLEAAGVERSFPTCDPMPASPSLECRSDSPVRQLPLDFSELGADVAVAPPAPRLEGRLCLQL